MSFFLFFSEIVIRLIIISNLTYNRMHRIVKIFLFLGLFLGVERLCHKATDGFALVNVYPPKGEYDRFDRAGPAPPDILDQTFTYLDSGSQSYVFLSEDQKVVLKLFKFQHMRTPPLLNFLPSKGILGKKREKKERVLHRTFESLTLAYDLMREETGLLYLHLQPTEHLGKQLKIIDKIGVAHTIELDKVPFLLQNRGTLAYCAIDTWMEKGEKRQAERGIKRLLRLAAARPKKGLFDKDPDFSTNFGFVGDAPFQIDFGRLSLSAEEKDPKVYGPEMIRITRDFQRWIAKNHPCLLHSFEEELDAIIHQ